MARYKPYNLQQSELIPLSYYADQIVPGSFEYAINEIVEGHLDLSVFERRYRNEENTTRWFSPRAPLSRATRRGAMAPVPCAAHEWTAQAMFAPRLHRPRVAQRHGIGDERGAAGSRAEL